LLANFTPLKQKAGDATEKDSKILILGILQNIIYLLFIKNSLKFSKKIKNKEVF